MYDTIVVPTNGSDEAADAYSHAIDIASQYGGEVHALFVAVPEGTPLSSGFSPEEVEDLFLDDAEHPGERLEELAAERDVPATAATRVGNPGEEIVDYARENDADLIVMGTHGRSGLERYLLGSTTERTLRRADVPVLCVPASD